MYAPGASVTFGVPHYGQCQRADEYHQHDRTDRAYHRGTYHNGGAVVLRHEEAREKRVETGDDKRVERPLTHLCDKVASEAESAPTAERHYLKMH